MGLLALLGGFCLASVTSPALAAPKKKKAAAAEQKAEAPADEEKSVDDLMTESVAPRKRASTDDESTTASESSIEADEPIGEPDAWERPPKDEEKPKVVEPPKVEEKWGDGRIEVGLAPVYGFKAGDAIWATVNPYSLGLGVRGGYEFDFKLFLGGGFVYHLGESDNRPKNTPGAPTPAIAEVTQNYMLAYVEVGYDIWLDNLLLRPSLWLGMGFAIVDPYLNTGGVRTVQDFLYAPGLNVLFIMDGWYIGVDPRYVAVTADGAAGIDLFGVIGLRFR